MAEVLKFKRKKRNIWLPLLLVLITAITGVLLAVNRNSPFVSSLLNFGYSSEGTVLDSSRTYRYARYNSGVAIYGADKISGIDFGGKEKWVYAFAGQTPRINSKGKHVIAWEDGGRELLLISSGNETLRMTTEDNIISAKVSESGRFTVISDERGFNNKVAVYDKDGQEVYSWHTSAYNVIDAALSDNGKILGVSVLCSPEEEGTSKVLLFDFKSSEGKPVETLNSNLVASVMFCGNNLVAIGDTEAFSVKSNGKPIYTINYGGRNLRSYGFSDDGTLALGFDEGTGGKVEIYKSNGKQSGVYSSNRQILYMDMLDGKTLVNSEGGAVVINQSGKEISNITFDKDIKNALLISGRRKVLGVSGDMAKIYTSR